MESRLQLPKFDSYSRPYAHLTLSGSAKREAFQFGRALPGNWTHGPSLNKVMRMTRHPFLQVYRLANMMFWAIVLIALTSRLNLIEWQDPFVAIAKSYRSLMEPVLAFIGSPLPFELPWWFCDVFLLWWIFGQGYMLQGFFYFASPKNADQGVSFHITPLRILRYGLGGPLKPIYNLLIIPFFFPTPEHSAMLESWGRSRYLKAGLLSAGKDLFMVLIYSLLLTLFFFLAILINTVT